MYVLKLDFAHLMGWPSDWANRPEYQAKALELKVKIQKHRPKTCSVVAERRKRNRCGTDKNFISVPAGTLDISGFCGCLEHMEQMEHI